MCTLLYLCRANKAELFDEFEEWVLMSTHYCMTLAVNDRAIGTSVSAPVAVAAMAAGEGPTFCVDVVPSGTIASASTEGADAGGGAGPASVLASGAVSAAVAGVDGRPLPFSLLPMLFKEPAS